MNTIHKYEAYLHFIEAIEVLKKLPHFPVLDSIESDLLNEISLRWKNGRSLLVNEAISIEKIGSRATLHARIKNLRQKGYVDFHNDIDGRKKILKPTFLAENYFSTLSELLAQAVERSNINNQSRNRRSTDRAHLGSASASSPYSFN